MCQLAVTLTSFSRSSRLPFISPNLTQLRLALTGVTASKVPARLPLDRMLLFPARVYIEATGFAVIEMSFQPLDSAPRDYRRYTTTSSRSTKVVV